MRPALLSAGRRVVAVLCAALLVAAAATVATPPAAAATQHAQPRGGAPGHWRQIGQTHASHKADHDTIVVVGPYDNFRRVKFTVTGAPLNMRYMIVTYDNGGTDRIELRQSIPKGGESRVIDLRGVGKRSLRRIDFWYDTAGMLNARAEVTVFGMK